MHQSFPGLLRQITHRVWVKRNGIMQRVLAINCNNQQVETSVCRVAAKLALATYHEHHRAAAPATVTINTMWTHNQNTHAAPGVAGLLGQLPEEQTSRPGGEVGYAGHLFYGTLRILVPSLRLRSYTRAWRSWPRSQMQVTRRAGRRGIAYGSPLPDRVSNSFPRADELPEDIRDLVLHQKHTVTHERFGRDVEDLAEAIWFARKVAQRGAGGGGSAARWIGVAALAVLLLGGGVLVYRIVAPGGDAEVRSAQGQADKDKADAAEKAWQEEAKRAAEAAAKHKADEETRAKRQAAATAERQRLAMLKAEQDRAEAEQLRPGRVFRDCADVCPEMVVLPPGWFMMGSPPEVGLGTDEGPQRKVTIDQPFAVGKFEVTFAEWDACVAERKCSHSPKDELGPRQAAGDAGVVG